MRIEHSCIATCLRVLKCKTGLLWALTFTSRKITLLHTITAVISYLDVDYYQGMNMIVGGILSCGLSQYETFTLVTALFEKFDLIRLFNDDFKLTFKLIDKTLLTVRQHCFRAWMILQEHESTLRSILLQWYLTLFVDFISIREVTNFPLLYAHFLVQGFPLPPKRLKCEVLKLLRCWNHPLLDR